MSKKHVQEAPITISIAKVPRFAVGVCLPSAIIELVLKLVINFQFNQVTLTIMITLLVNGGISYALSSFLENSPTDGSRIVKDFLISALIINIIFIGAIAVFTG